MCFSAPAVRCYSLLLGPLSVRVYDVGLRICSIPDSVAHHEPAKQYHVL
jgi:hypothetical protein